MDTAFLIVDNKVNNPYVCIRVNELSCQILIFYPIPAGTVSAAPAFLWYPGKTYETSYFAVTVILLPSILKFVAVRSDIVCSISDSFLSLGTSIK